jgi:hypothetical protein
VIIESGSMLRKVGFTLFRGCDWLPRIEVFPDFTAIQRDLFRDDKRKLWVREIENGWSFLRKFDEYYLLEEAPIGIDKIAEKGKLMGLSDLLFCRCVFEGISIPSFVNRIAGRWTGIDYDIGCEKSPRPPGDLPTGRSISGSISAARHTSVRKDNLQ